MRRWEHWDSAPIGIRAARKDPRIDDTAGRPHTIVVIDRLIRADHVEEMSRMLRQPVLAFHWAQRFSDGSGVAAYSALSVGERAEIAHTFKTMREDVAPSPEALPHPDEYVRGCIAEMKSMLEKLEHAAETLQRDSSAEDICVARVEADGVLDAAEEIATGLFGWELAREEIESERADRSGGSTPKKPNEPPSDEDR
jgi:hypothetical protein